MRSYSETRSVEIQAYNVPTASEFRGLVQQAVSPGAVAAQDSPLVADTRERGFLIYFCAFEGVHRFPKASSQAVAYLVDFPVPKSSVLRFAKPLGYPELKAVGPQSGIDGE